MTAVVNISLDQLASNFGYAARYADRAMEDVRKDAAKMIMAEMLRLVPRDTGNLARSISIRHAPGRTEIGPTGVHYAGYVEFGTAPHLIKPKNVQNLRFTINGRTFYAKSVQHPGTQAQPYIRPAAEKWLTYLGIESGNAAVKMLRKA